MADEDYIFALPYHWIIIPDAATGTYTAYIDEFPGCVAQGDSIKEALERLAEVAMGWVALTRAKNLPIPAPRKEIK